MYVARKPLSIGPRGFARGAVIDREAQEVLREVDPTRLMKMVEHGDVMLLSDEAEIEHRIVVLEDTVAKLTARLTALESRRGPGRPRKEETENG